MLTIFPILPCLILSVLGYSITFTVMARSGKGTRECADSENKGEKQENDEIPGRLCADNKHSVMLITCGLYF